MAAHDRAARTWNLEKASAFGMHGEEVDGMDVLAVEEQHKEQLSALEQEKGLLF